MNYMQKKFRFVLKQLTFTPYKIFGQFSKFVKDKTYSKSKMVVIIMILKVHQITITINILMVHVNTSKNK